MRFNNFVAPPPPSLSLLSTGNLISKRGVSRFRIKCRAVDTPKRDGLETILDSLLDSSNKQTHILHSSSLNPSLNYLVSTPEFIRGHLEELMFLEAATRYMRAKQYSLLEFNDSENSNIHHHWQIVESFKAQISQRSRERLLLFDSSPGLGIGAYADALSAVAVIDELHAIQVFHLFLDSRKSCIAKKLGACLVPDIVISHVISLCSQVLIIIQVTLAQVGELFMQFSTDMPLFYRTVLSSSQLFGSDMISLRSKLKPMSNNIITQLCYSWWKDCENHIITKMYQMYLFYVFQTGRDLVFAEKKIRETLEEKQVLEGSLGWIKSVFGYEPHLPWNKISQLVLGYHLDLWLKMFEMRFVGHMRDVIDIAFYNMSQSTNLMEAICGIAEATGGLVDFESYLTRSSLDGVIWSKKLACNDEFSWLESSDFCTCLDDYLGVEVIRIVDVLDSHCESILDDLMSFLEGPNSSFRLKHLAPCMQRGCYLTVKRMLGDLETQMEDLCDAMENRNKEGELVIPAVVTVQKSLFIGRLLFALNNHSKQIPILLGSPKLWVNKAKADISSSSPVDSLGFLEKLNKETQDLCIIAHDLWISWVSDELSAILSSDLMQDDSLLATTLLEEWEDKQEQSAESLSEMKISPPSMPSFYITSFLLQACEEIHRVGVHFLDRIILQNFASKLLEKVTSIYEKLLSSEGDFVTRVSKRGALQIILDLRFSADILSVGRESIDRVISDLAHGLDPLTYEPCVRAATDHSSAFRCLLFGQAVKLDASSGCSTTC